MKEGMKKTVAKPAKDLPGKLAQMLGALFTDRKKIIDAGNGDDFVFFIGNRRCRLTKKVLEYDDFVVKTETNPGTEPALDGIKGE